MWWLAFTAIDLYIGVVLLDVLARGDAVPAEKHRRMVTAKKITLALLALTLVVLLAKLIARKWM